MLEPESIAEFEDENFPRRRLRVRHAYPQPLIELSNELLRYLRPREVATLLDIPISSVYRWKSKQSRLCNPVIKSLHISALRELSERCLRAGIAVPSDITQMVAAGGVEKASAKAAVENDAPGHIGGVPLVVAHQRLSRRAAALQASADIADRVERARQFILCDYFSDIDSTTLAGIAEMSRYHLIRVFNARYGTSPHQYLMQVRVDAAKALLATSNETIDVIAVATGFRTGSSLNRTFRRREGKPPSDFSPILNKKQRG